MRAKRGVLAALVCLLMLTGCTHPQQPDASGVTESEALGMSLKEQYRLAGDRHQELNERLAELQAEIFENEWLDGAVSSEVAPGNGYSLGDLRGVTRDNSYYFTVSRWYFTEVDMEPTLQKIAGLWEARGWKVGSDVFSNGDIRITTTTKDGYWFEASEESDGLELSGHTPAYWGQRRALSHAIAERRNAEDDAGVHWDTTDLDEKGHAYRLPGVFRPFPAWDIPLEEDPDAI